MQLKRWDIASFGTFVISGNIKPVIEIQDPHLPIPEIPAHLLYHSLLHIFYIIVLTVVMSMILEITKVKILKRLKYTKDFGFDFLVYYLQLSHSMFFSIDF